MVCEGQQILSEHFSWTKISSTTSKIFAWKHDFTLYFNETAIAFSTEQ